MQTLIQQTLSFYRNNGSQIVDRSFNFVVKDLEYFIRMKKEDCEYSHLIDRYEYENNCFTIWYNKKSNAICRQYFIRGLVE